MLKHKLLLVLASAIVLVAGGGTALAVASGPVATGVIYGCYTNAAINGTHAIVLQNAGSSCPPGTTAVSWDQTGPQGPQGIQGPAGPNGTNGTNGTNGNTVLNGTGAPASTVGNDGDFYIDTSADVLYGPKTSGTWPTPGTSLVGNPGAAGATGPQGPAGPAGPQGPAGPAGTGISSVSDLNGLACTALDGSAGTITLSTDDNSGVISMTCAGGAAPFNCLHSNGVGQNYTDCQDALGTFGDPATYNEGMAVAAAQAYLNSVPGSGDLLFTDASCAGQDAVDVAPNGGTPVYSWVYTGSAAGYGEASCGTSAASNEFNWN